MINEHGVPEERGTLYLCATPIGNLGDMTYRAVSVLSSVPLIAAEDTRRTLALLSHFGIKNRLVSYHEHNKTSRTPRLVEWLLSGRDLACVTDAGFPGISDPGEELARAAAAAGVRVVPVPGANAALTALIGSGLPCGRFTFLGFLPRTREKRAALLREISGRTDTLIIYEAPHRLKATLEELLKSLGDREAAICRELTKKFEEFRRGMLSELADFAGEPRGEFVIVISGADSSAAQPAETTLSPAETALNLMAAGMAKKEAMREAAKRCGVSRRDVYSALIKGGSQA